MSDLGLAVAHLVEKTTTGGKDWELREAVDAVLRAFDPKDTKGSATALAALGKGVKASEGRAAQVLLLALGALVESGASPELAWPAIEHGLVATLDGATKYAQACLDRVDHLALDEAVKSEREPVKKKMPKETAAWDLLRSKCMAATACLTRSPALRAKVRASGKLMKAADPLVDYVDEVTAFSRVLRILHDEPLLVIHLEQRKGWRFTIRDLSTTTELYVLLLDAIVGEPSRGLLAAKRPNPKAVLTIKDPDNAPKNTAMLDVPFHTVAWPGLLPDGSMPDPKSEEVEHHNWVWLEGVPAEIPPFEGERVILLQGPVMKRDVEVPVPYDALFPTLAPRGKVSRAEVDRLVARMTAAATKLRKKAKPARSAKPANKAKPAKPAAKTKPAKSPKAKKTARPAKKPKPAKKRASR
jgi:hypothetical protein